MYNCVSIWALNQVEWPRPIRSELHVESLKRLKHAVHDEWLGTLLMSRIKIVLNCHNRGITVNMYSADILDIGFPCMRSILYTWSCAIQTLVGICRDEWLGTLLMSRIKIVLNCHNHGITVNIYSADILDIGFPCMRSILYTWSCAIQTLVGICHDR